MAASVSESTRSLVLKLHDIGAVKLGTFTLKSGIVSPVYVDLRLTISHPQILSDIAAALLKATKEGDGGSSWDIMCGVPYTALPFATAMALQDSKPMVMRRKEAKKYGTKKIIEGDFAEGQNCLIVEDLVTTGLSVMETVEPLKDAGLQVTDVVVLLDREQGGRPNLECRNMRLHSVMTMTQVLDILVEEKRIEVGTADSVRSFIRENQVIRGVEEESQTAAPPKSYSQRIPTLRGPVSKRLFAIMEEKKTNLCVAADVSTKSELLKLADDVGPAICLLKTHADVIDDWDAETGARLQELASKHKFLIFEDRKFADIGNTVVSQCSSGVHRIAEWADIINAHAVPGPGIIDGLQKAASSSGRDLGLLLLAEMSSAGNLATNVPGYTEATTAMAGGEDEFVCGFISMGAIASDEYVYMTPGVQLNSGVDALGQQYMTPEVVVGEKKSDIIIVGRGIYKAPDALEAAQSYQSAGWSAYERRLKS